MHLDRAIWVLQLLILAFIMAFTTNFVSILVGNPKMTSSKSTDYRSIHSRQMKRSCSILKHLEPKVACLGFLVGQSASLINPTYFYSQAEAQQYFVDFYDSFHLPARMELAYFNCSNQSENLGYFRLMRLLRRNCSRF